ncbi:hypothetical protein Lbir_0863 [Legionella birminghamensis]|uniref:Uncharacterized protein n=1 Tax=Legionella birminghamensis TaxID=28083 RepID=A0A378I8Z8_9GAMM|nr:hypothetical protein [Legionella birminghamensis]KTC74398.1 hypothetical protein Lbir_0863 [Legionella birminghamensis]STX31687.1 Uncharacterised protein [Legionella birminghamensis]
MSGWFSEYYKSSSTHRQSQKISAFATVVEKAISNTDVTSIPTKIVQAGSSLYTMFCTSTHLSEKILNGLEAGIALSQIGLLIALYFEGQECVTDEHSLCKAYLLLEMGYNGFLALGMGTAEVSKEPVAPAATAPTV